MLYKKDEFSIRLAKRVCDIEGEIAPRNFEIWTEGIKSKNIWTASGRKENYLWVKVAWCHVVRFDPLGTEFCSYVIIFIHGRQVLV